MVTQELLRAARRQGRAARRWNDLDASTVLGTLGAVFSFFSVADAEFVVLALPLSAAGIVAGIARLRRLGVARTSRTLVTLLGITLSMTGFVVSVVAVALTAVS